MMKRKRINYLIQFLLFAFFSFASSAQNQVADSTTIARNFLNALMNPLKADSLIQEAQRINQENLKSEFIQDVYWYNASKYLFQTGRLDSSMSCAKLGADMYASNLLNYKSAKFHNLIGSIHSYKKSYELAILEFQYAIKILELNGDNYTAALVKNNIANLFFSLTDYESSYKYSAEACSILKEENDTINLPALIGINAISAIKLGNMTEGQKLTKESLALSEKYKNPIGLIVANFSNGTLEIVNHNFELAVESFLQSLEISYRIGNKHYIMLNKIELLHSYVKLQEYATAIKYGLEALEESKALENENTFYSIYKNLGYAYFGLGEYKNSYTNLNTAHDLYISTANIQNKKSINDILIKYDTQKKEKELAESELVVAQNEVKLSKRKIWIIGLALIVLLLLVSYFFYARLQHQRFLQLKENQKQNKLLASLLGEEKERERISNELHDGIASSITAIKIELENLALKDKNDALRKLATQLSNLHEETRKISHNLMPFTLTKSNFFEALGNYCAENSNQQLKIHFVNNVLEEINLVQSVSIVLYRIMQELINNVVKHAQSPICYVQVTLINNELILSIEDEGVGFVKTKNINSQGLLSIEKRLQDIGGEFIIESKLNQGTLASIHFKLN